MVEFVVTIIENIKSQESTAKEDSLHKKKTEMEVKNMVRYRLTFRTRNGAVENCFVSLFINTISFMKSDKIKDFTFSILIFCFLDFRRLFSCIVSLLRKNILCFLFLKK